MSNNKSKPKKDNRRVRCWFIERNYDYDIYVIDANGAKVLRTTYPTEQEWREDIKATWPTVVGLARIAFVFHDNDVEDDGAATGLHAHAVVWYNDGKYFHEVVNHFGLSGRDKNCQETRNKVDAVRYLIHITEEAINEKKHKYPITDVYVYDYDPDQSKRQTANDLMARKDAKKAVLEKVVDTLIDKYCPLLRAGEISILDMQGEFLEKCGERLWKQYKPIFENASDEYFPERVRYYQTNKRFLKTVIITGRNGAGKTELGIHLAELLKNARGIHFAPVKGETTFDFVGDYKGELVTFSDEFQRLPFDQFNNVFNPQRFAMVSSRNTNKPWFANWCIFTTALTFERWITELLSFTPGGSKYQDTTAPHGVVRLKRDEQTINCAGMIRRRLHFNLNYVQRDGAYYLDVYGLIFSRRNETFPNSHALLGSIQHNEFMEGDEFNAIAEQIKLLIEGHDEFDKKWDNYVTPQIQIEPPKDEVTLPHFAKCGFESGIRYVPSQKPETNEKVIKVVIDKQTLYADF